MSDAKPEAGAREERGRKDDVPEPLLNNGLTEDDLRAVQGLALREELWTGTVHEMLNPLAAILAHLDVLQVERGSDPVVASHLDVLIPQVQRLAAILYRAKVYDMAPVEKSSGVDLATTVVDVVRLVEYHFSAHHVRFHIDPIGSLPPLTASASGLQQAWLNYFTNAFHAIRSRGEGEGTIRVKINHFKKLGQILIEISDNGAGMDADTLQALNRGGKSLRAIGVRESGRIIAEHGGSVDFTSKPGRGTTVRVLLPVSETRVTPVQDRT